MTTGVESIFGREVLQVGGEKMPRRIISILQIISIALIWVFVITVTLWIINLIRVAHRLHDALDASVGISLVAIPLFLFLASILTYVYIGLRRGLPGQGLPSQGLRGREPERS